MVRKVETVLLESMDQLGRPVGSRPGEIGGGLFPSVDVSRIGGGPVGSVDQTVFVGTGQSDKGEGEPGFDRGLDRVPLGVIQPLTHLVEEAAIGLLGGRIVSPFPDEACNAGHSSPAQKWLPAVAVSNQPGAIYGVRRYDATILNGTGRKRGS